MKKKIGIIIAIVVLVLVLSLCAIFLYFRSKASLLNLDEVDAVEYSNEIEGLLLNGSEATSVTLTEEECKNFEQNTQEKIITPEDSEITIKKDYPKYVKVEGNIYVCTNLEDTRLKCGVMDGTITSTVEEKDLPVNDNESNFGTGYQYQFSTSDELLVVIDGKWYTFAKQK